VIALTPKIVKSGTPDQRGFLRTLGSGVGFIWVNLGDLWAVWVGGWKFEI